MARYRSKKEKLGDILYRNTHREELSMKNKEYRALHKIQKNEYARLYHIKNREKKVEYLHNYYLSHKQDYYNYRKKRYAENLDFRLRTNLRSRFAIAVKNKQKSGVAIDDLGCSIPELKFYLEGKFTEGMSWENHGLHGWHIDHIIPISYFDLVQPEQRKQALHYTNLQPLWAVDNLSKGKKLLYNKQQKALLQTNRG